MGCCESREKEGPLQVDHELQKVLASEFSNSRQLVAHSGEPDLEHFSHSFQVNSSAKIHDVYDMKTFGAGSNLGEGMAGTVRQATNKSTKAVRAVKVINVQRCEKLAALKDEVGIMRMLDHPHIIKLFEVFHDADDFLYLVMELCTGGDLLDRTQLELETRNCAFSEHRAADWMKQTLSAVFYLHKHNIVHRDLKPENLMLEDRTEDALIKLIDFGIAAKLKEGGLLRQRVGTPTYCAPEVLKGQYIHKCDVWSCGVICYILLSGCPVFQGRNDREVMREIKKGKYSFPDDPWSHISDEAKDFISQILVVDYSARPEASDLLKHPWVLKEASTKQSPQPALQEGLLRNFQAYNRSRKLKKVALTLVATQMQSKDLTELRNQFEALDKDGDGTLSREELKQGLSSMSLGSEDAEMLMSHIDSDGSGELDWTEFIAAALDSKQYQKKEVLWSAFRVFDVDGDGKISKSELRAVLEVGNGVGIEEEQLKELIAEADQDGDGSIDFEEFCAMMKQ